jgi:hypothetical protein
MVDWWDMVRCDEPYFLWQSACDVSLEKKPYKILSDDIFLPKPYVVYIRKPHTYATCDYIEFCQIIVTLKLFMLSWSRSLTLHLHILNFYTGSYRNIHPSTKKYILQSVYESFSLDFPSKETWAIKKKR